MRGLKSGKIIPPNRSGRIACQKSERLHCRKRWLTYLRLGIFMFLATVNKTKQLLCLNYIHQVEVEELKQGREELMVLLADLTSGFSLVTDLSRLDSMDVTCMAEIGKIMEICEQKGVGLVVRVIPDPAKDIGLSILSIFHYHPGPRTITCNNMVEAAKLLSL
jgi:anti-anti-sigma regulatory factor